MKVPIIITMLFFLSCCTKQLEAPSNIEIPANEVSTEPEVNESNLLRTISGKVIHISDGDTLIIEDSTGYKTVIRLAGIDAPESDQSFGKAAKRTLEYLVGNRDVIVQTSKNDRYDRTVGKVIVGKRDICFEMIWSGMAWHFKRYEDEQPELDRLLYAKSESQARKERKGLWRERKPIPPWDFRDTQQTY